MASVKSANNPGLFCHDCKKEIKVKNKEIKNGVMLAYEDGGEKIKIVKCDECYRKNRELSNFRKCEVYSRIVGYIRPVSQWNEGKTREYQERKTYKLSNKC